MADIFISYSRRDQRQAERLAEALRHEGWTVWWDAFLYVGREFPDGIRRALDEARCIVVLWSSASAGSEWVMTEARAGVDRNVLVPVRLEADVVIPKPFERIHAAGLIDWDGHRRHHGYQRLTEGITRVAGAPRPLATEPLEFAQVMDIPGASGLTGAFGSLWVSAETRPSLVRVDPGTRELVAAVDVNPAWSVVAGPHHVWTLHSTAISRVAPEGNQISGQFKTYRGGVDWAAATARVLWLMAMPQSLTPEICALPSDAARFDQPERVFEISPTPDPFVVSDDRLVVRSVSNDGLHVLSGPPVAVDITLPIEDIQRHIRCEDALWCKTTDEERWKRVDLRTFEITEPRLPHGSRILAEVNQVVYVEITRAGGVGKAIARLHRSSEQLESLHDLDRVGGGCWVGGGYLWVECSLPPRLLQIDLETASLVAEITLTGSLSGYRYHGGALWTVEAGSGDLSRVSPTLSRITAAIPAGSDAFLHFDSDAIWVLRGSQLCRWGISDKDRSARGGSTVKWPA